MALVSLKRRNASSAIFVVGLLLAAGLSLALDGAGRAAMLTGRAVIDTDARVHNGPAAPRALADDERAAAETAWTYIAANTQATGLVNAVHNYPSATLWDQGSYLLGLISARRLGVIDQATFDDRAARFVSAIGALPLVDGILPNKAYDTRSLEMVDYTNVPQPDGIGWSALDIARLLGALRILEREAPSLGGAVREAIADWRLDAMTHDGVLMGATRDEGVLVHTQEGRIGYEQYAARAAALWGLDVVSAMSSDRIMQWRTVSGVEVPTDLRTARAFDAITPVLSEPWLLQAFELGLDSEGHVLADRVYRAQEERWRTTGIITMVSEDHVIERPYFLYSTVFSNGDDWAVVAENGARHDELRWVSLKAAFGWHSLYGTPYTERVVGTLRDLADPERGWAAGRFERDGRPNSSYTLNTNGIVLEALHFARFGPLIRS